MGAKSTLTVLFEAPFWIGIYERFDAGMYEAAKLTFGAEPKDGEIYEFVLKSWHTLSFSAPAAAQTRPERSSNPKRAQREIRAQLQPANVGTKAQQALQQPAGAERHRAKTARPRTEASGQGAPVRTASAEEKEQTPRQIDAKGCPEWQRA